MIDDPLAGYLLDGTPPKAEAIAAVLARPSGDARAQPFYRALGQLGAKAADEALLALRLVLGGNAPTDEAIRELRELRARAAAGDAAARRSFLSQIGTLALAAVLVLAVVAPVCAQPVPSEPPMHNAGVIIGRVTQVDYAHGTIAVESGRRAVTIAVMPSTPVQSETPGYRTLSDVTRGDQVEVFASQVGGRFVAQIIRLVRR